MDILPETVLMPPKALDLPNIPVTRVFSNPSNSSHRITSIKVLRNFPLTGLYAPYNSYPQSQGYQDSYGNYSYPPYGPYPTPPPPLWSQANASGNRDRQDSRNQNNRAEERDSVVQSRTSNSGSQDVREDLKRNEPFSRGAQ